MIRYELVCDKGDRFEAWFRGSGDFDAQAAGGLLSCPACGSTVVEKALMAPSVRSSKKRASAPAEQESEPAAPKTELIDTARLTAGADPALSKAMDLVRRIAREVRANSEDVGRRFAEEARKIHYRESEPRSIVGEATEAEARELLEEGIEFQPLPILPEERN